MSKKSRDGHEKDAKIPIEVSNNVGANAAGEQLVLGNFISTSATLKIDNNG